MVREAVEPYATRCRSLRCSLVFSLRLEEVRHPLYLVLEECQLGVVFLSLEVEEVWRHHNLVEEVVRAIIHQSTRTLFRQKVIPRVVHVAILNLRYLWLCRQVADHALVVRVVVHVTHDEYLPLWIFGQQLVLDDPYLPCSRLSVERTAETAWPVAYYDDNRLVGYLALHGKKSSCLERAVLLQFLYILVQGVALILEQAGIVEQCAVHPTLVRSLNVCELEVARLQLGLVNEVGESLGILYLAYSYDSAPHSRQHVSAHIGQRTGHIVQLVRIPYTIPPVRACWQELIIVLALVMACVEKVLKIVEPHSIHGILLLRLSKKSHQQHGRCQN